MTRTYKILLTIALILTIPFTSHLYFRIETYALDQLSILQAKTTSYLLIKYSTKPNLKNLVLVEAKARGINPALAFALIEQESGWNTSAIRPEPKLNTMTIGLFQIMPSTAKACPGSPSATALFHPVTNTQCGLDLLSSYLQKTGSARKALVAYNGGEHCLIHHCAEAEAYAKSVLTRFSELTM